MFGMEYINEYITWSVQHLSLQQGESQDPNRRSIRQTFRTLTMVTEAFPTLGNPNPTLKSIHQHFRTTYHHGSWTHTNSPIRMSKYQNLNISKYEISSKSFDEKWSIYRSKRRKFTIHRGWTYRLSMGRDRRVQVWCSGWRDLIVNTVLQIFVLFMCSIYYWFIDLFILYNIIKE